MNNDIVNFQKGVATQPQNNYQATRAKSFKVIAPTQNYSQYIRTVKAYALAGLPFEHIANAGNLLGDKTEKGEIDASIEANWQDKAGEVAEDDSKILAWQNRGERILITRQLSQPISTIYNQQPQSLQNASNSNAQLENNPYLKTPPNLNKST